MERNVHRFEQYSRHECVQIAGIPGNITNYPLEEHVIPTFDKLGVVMEAMDIVACHRVEKTVGLLLNCLTEKALKMSWNRSKIISFIHTLSSTFLFSIILLTTRISKTLHNFTGELIKIFFDKSMFS